MTLLPGRPPLDIPAVVRAKALAFGADQWLRDLPDLIESLERDWSVAVGAAYSGGTEAYVAAATLADGTPAVLKLAVPREGGHARREITVLRLADGHGCARLLRFDEPRGALLVERLGPSMYDLGLPARQRQQILCDAAARIWRPAPGRSTYDLPAGDEMGRWLAQFIAATWEELDHPCSERAVASAVACAQRRAAAHDDERAVLLHGDVHQWNALQSADGFKLVDPDGLLAEPEYDLGVIMREDPVELLAGDPFERARWLAARTGLDATAIWEWGVAERVSTGLLATRIGLQPAGRDMLATADYLAGLPDAGRELHARVIEGVYYLAGRGAYHHDVHPAAADRCRTLGAGSGAHRDGHGVEFHLGNIYRKLGVRSRTELLRRVAGLT